jgi:hypothetical protein
LEQRLVQVCGGVRQVPDSEGNPSLGWACRPIIWPEPAPHAEDRRAFEAGYFDADEVAVV